MTRHTLLALILILIPPARAGQQVLLRDVFDDGNPATNQKGVGGGWTVVRQGQKRVSDVAESGSLLRFPSWGDVHRKRAPGAGDGENVQLTSEALMPVMTSEGLTAQMTVKNVMASGKNSKAWTPRLVSAYPGGAAADYLCQFGLVEKDSTEVYLNTKGGMYLTLHYVSQGEPEEIGSKESRDLRVIGNLRFINKEKAPNTRDEFKGNGIYTAAIFELEGYKGQEPLTVKLSATQRGWSASLDRPVKMIRGRLSGNWTTDLPNASITDEFNAGVRAFLMVGKMANGYGSLDVEKVEVVRGAGREIRK